MARLPLLFFSAAAVLFTGAAAMYFVLSTSEYGCLVEYYGPSAKNIGSDISGFYASAPDGKAFSRSAVTVQHGAPDLLGAIQLGLVGSTMRGGAHLAYSFSSEHGSGSYDLITGQPPHVLASAPVTSTDDMPPESGWESPDPSEAGASGAPIAPSLLRVTRCSAAPTSAAAAATKAGTSDSVIRGVPVGGRGGGGVLVGGGGGGGLAMLAAQPVTALLLLLNGGAAWLLKSRGIPVDTVSISYDAVIGRQEHWRVITACFSHYELMHLAFNGATLYALGDMVEGERCCALWRARSTCIISSLTLTSPPRGAAWRATR